MTRIRIAYGLSTLFTFVVFLWNGTYFALGLFLLEIFLFFGLKLFLLLETSRLKLSLSLPSACTCGQKVRLNLSGSSFFAISTAVIEGDLIRENRLLGNTSRSRFSANLTLRGLELFLDFQPECCGSYVLRLENIRCFDIFGLNQVRLPSPDPCRIIVYPKPISMHLQSEAAPYGQMDEGQHPVNRHGHDVTEIFDLREYQPGDDIHTIHWKLSQKMENLLVREPADSPRYDTLILMDIGQNENGSPMDPKLLSMSVSLTLSISRELLKRQIPHHVGTVSGKRLLITEVREAADFRNLLSLWMGISIPKEKGLGMRLLSIDQQEENYRRLFYLTTGACPDGIDQIRPDLITTALCLYENQEETAMIRHGNRLFINLTMEQAMQGGLNLTL